MLPVARAVAEQLGEAEVEDLGEAVVRHHHVVGLEVAVHDPGRVGLGEALGDLGPDLEDATRGHRLAVAHELVERRAQDALHHDVRKAGGLADLVDGDDVRVIEGGRGPRLLCETAHPLRVGRVALGQELDRDLALEILIERAPDFAHPARAQPGEKLVAAETHADSWRHGGSQDPLEVARARTRSGGPDYAGRPARVKLHEIGGPEARSAHA